MSHASRELLGAVNYVLNNVENNMIFIVMCFVVV